MLSNKDIETIKMCLNRVYNTLKGDTAAQIKGRKDIEETIKNLDNHVEQFKKQIFQLGDTVYWYDDDYKYFESVIKAIFSNGEKLMSEAAKKLLVADNYFKKFDEELEKVRKPCDIIPDTEQILKELSTTEEPSKIREGKHKKKNKSFKNWEHREFWRG